MSHTMSVQVELKDYSILQKAVKNVGGRIEKGSFTLFDGNNIKGTGVFLNGWKYPIVIQDDGTCKYDNYNGSWGAIERFNELKQQYSLEAVKEKLAKNKMKASVTTDNEGKIILKVKVA